MQFDFPCNSSATAADSIYTRDILRINQQLGQKREFNPKACCGTFNLYGI